MHYSIDLTVDECLENFWGLELFGAEMASGLVAGEFGVEVDGELLASGNRYVRVIFGVDDSEITAFVHQVGVIKWCNVELVAVGTVRLVVEVARNGDDLVDPCLCRQGVDPPKQRHGTTGVRYKRRLFKVYL